ncbi:MAG: hypothetical protein VX130_05160 [Verrucomicrobiota bacterium]|nr:hypothetical protein [Verrucomicrobiota bacterium]
MYQSPEVYAEEAAAFCELVFQAYAYCPSLGPLEDLKTVELIREAVGSKVGLCLDTHAWWKMGHKSYSSTIVDSLIASCFPRETARWLEYPKYAHRDSRVIYPFPLSDEIIPDAPVPEEGELPLPESYWLGVEINEKIFQKYPYL